MILAVDKGSECVGISVLHHVSTHLHVCSRLSSLPRAMVAAAPCELRHSGIMMAVRDCGCAARLHSCLLQTHGITCNRVLTIRHADTAVVVCKGDMQGGPAIPSCSGRSILGRPDAPCFVPFRFFLGLRLQ